MGNITEVKIYKNPKKVYNAIAKNILKITSESNQKIFDIALSGGNSPKGLFKKMSKKYHDQIPWGKIHFWWGDERCVAPDDEQSNYKMAVDYLFSRIEIPKNNIHRIRGEEDPESEVIRYSKELTDTLKARGKNPVFDLIILGLGEDGHTASIFPDQIELVGSDSACAVAEHPLTGQKRITFTGHILNNANRVFFLVTGESKAMRVSEIMNDSEAAKLLPAYYIAPKNGEMIWFLDEAAATLIS